MTKTRCDEFLQGCFMLLHASSPRTSVCDVSDLMIGKALCHAAVFLGHVMGPQNAFLSFNHARIHFSTHCKMM